MKRIRNIWRKSKLKTLQTIVIFLVVVAFSVVPIILHGMQFFYLLATGSLSLIIPYFFRNIIVENDVIHKVIKVSAYVIVAGIFILKKYIINGGPIIHCAGLAFLGIYISSYFWLLSDESIILLKNSKK